VEHHPSFFSQRLDEINAALDEALPACHTACKRRRLLCLQAIATRLSADQLHAALGRMLGEVVLATKESNVKSRAAAFDALLLIAERAQAVAPARGYSTRSPGDVRGGALSHWSHRTSPQSCTAASNDGGFDQLVEQLRDQLRHEARMPAARASALFSPPL